MDLRKYFIGFFRWVKIQKSNKVFSGCFHPEKQYFLAVLCSGSFSFDPFFSPSRLVIFGASIQP